MNRRGQQVGGVSTVAKHGKSPCSWLESARQQFKQFCGYTVALRLDGRRREASFLGTHMLELDRDGAGRVHRRFMSLYKKPEHVVATGRVGVRFVR